MYAKAIETRYNGFRFRSRLEARWAVFLDALKINYRYEPEGFELPSVRYLPDFLLPLPEPKVWIEIKPEVPTTEDACRSLFQKSFELSRGTKQHVVTIFGDPYPGQYQITFVGYCPESDELVMPVFGQTTSRQILFAESDCGAIHVVDFDTADGKMIATIRLREPTRECPTPEACRMRMFENRKGMSEGSSELLSAFVSAREARFEHGESGPPKS